VIEITANPGARRDQLMRENCADVAQGIQSTFTDTYVTGGDWIVIVIGTSDGSAITDSIGGQAKTQSDADC
jgi:hypothetical protein